MPNIERSDIPAAVTRSYPQLARSPEVVEVFKPGAGWQELPPLTATDQRLGNANRQRSYPLSRRISRAYARALARQGVTAVALNLGGNRRADFTTSELGAA